MDRAERTHVEATIRSHAFSLVYQPIVDLETGEVSGVEALSRFDDGRPPDVWFKQAEQLGLAAALDLAVIEVALADLDRLPEGYVSLNVSLATVSAPASLIEVLRPVLRLRRVVVELTEHSVVHDYAGVADALACLRSAGMLLAVDDAGAGYSTFQHILRLRPDIIKLDRSITQRIHEDPARRALTSALVILASEINASVVAEGIETEAELATLRTTGVARGQGYWLGRPGPLPLPAVTYTPSPYVDLLRDVRASALDVGPRARSFIKEAADDATVAVVAHSVMRSMASVASGIELLQAKDGTLSLEKYRALCSVMQRQVAFVIEILEDLLHHYPMVVEDRTITSVRSTAVLAEKVLATAFREMRDAKTATAGSETDAAWQEGYFRGAIQMFALLKGSATGSLPEHLRYELEAASTYA